jgi:hypothetical protein
MTKRFYVLTALLLLCAFATLSIVVVSRHMEGAERRAKSVLFSISLLFSHWQSRLYTPTQLTKIGSLYFIVDCWHNRILYSHSLDAPIRNWRVLDGELAGPHSIASDSTLYVVDDTGRDALRVYRSSNDTFRLVETIHGCGHRPHRVRYDPTTSAFYVLASESQQISKITRNSGKLHVEYTKYLPFLEHTYTRSFSIIDGFMYFVSGPKAITKVRYQDDSYQLLETFPVPSQIQSGNDLFKIGEYYYLTSTPRYIIRAKSLDALRNGEWEDLYSCLRLKGTPYYLAQFDDRIFVPQITEYSGVTSFVERDGILGGVRTVFDSGPPTPVDEYEKDLLPK